MNKEENNPGGYSQEYVEKLRREAADWRTKYRDLESKTVYSSVEVELQKRGVKADPKWVEVNDGMSAADAVENFVAKYPHLMSGPTNTVEPQRPQKPNLPQAQGGGTPNTNLPSNPSQGRSLEEIKKDPVARSQLRDRYRQLIQQQSRQRDPTAF